MAVSFHNELLRFNLEQKSKHRIWISQCIEACRKKPGDLAFIFTTNEQLRKINRKYLNHNYFTDVITFDYSDEEIISGDIFISLDQVKINAEIFRAKTDDELRRVMIHGVLHLLGYKDDNEDEKETMQKKENDALHLWLKPA